MTVTVSAIKPSVFITLEPTMEGHLHQTCESKAKISDFFLNNMNVVTVVQSPLLVPSQLPSSKAIDRRETLATALLPDH